jgi:ubiquinone/menaquinone biosynthesis C-methylase UbiE
MAATLEISPQELAGLAGLSGDLYTPDNDYFAAAEASMAPLWEQLIAPFLEGCDFSHTLDLATGHGRNSEILAGLAGRLTLMDIQPGNIEVCRRRFASRTNLDFVVNNGFDLQPVADADVTLVYSFDSMVQFDSDVVRSYLRDTCRVLVPGGRGFFHHSNSAHGHGGRSFMTRELFAHYARKEGLTVLTQQVIDWSGEPGLDCLTLVERGDSGATQSAAEP